VIGGINKIIVSITGAINLLVQFGDKLQWLSTLVPGFAGGSKILEGANLSSPLLKGLGAGGGALTNSITVRGGKPDTGLELPTFSGPAAKVKDFQALVRDTTDTVGDLRDTTVEAFTSMADAIARGVSPLQAIADELGDIGKMLLNAGIKALISAAFGSVALPQGLGIAGGALSKFANGGSFTVGGSTSGDRNLVSFMANAGEQVEITPPGQSRGASAVFNVYGSRGDAAAIANAIVETRVPQKITQQQQNKYRR
jgi:hypothetical protein